MLAKVKALRGFGAKMRSLEVVAVPWGNGADRPPSATDRPARTVELRPGL